MDATTIIAAGIVLCGVVLIVAAGLTAGAEEAPPVRAAAVPAKVWCPVAQKQTRVGIGHDPAGRGFTLVWCDRFPAGPIGCDRVCLPAKAAA